MDVNDAAAYLVNHMAAIHALTKGISDEQARWRPAANAWSILEVVNHLLDEEREDFRVRLDCILHRPGEPWTGIDPPGWVTERAYNERELQPSVEQLLQERADSIRWLQGLVDADLGTAAAAPWGGTIPAGDMLWAWVAHDVLHLRQLVELRYALVAESAAPYSPEYAGDW